MTDELSSRNPYDFRSAVRRSSLLAGRDDELRTIDEMLRDSTPDTPTHLSLFGAQGTGKSSLLNGATDLACARGMMAVRLALTSAIVETDLDFYRAVYDAALQTLVDAGRITAGDELMNVWMLRAYSGVAPSNPTEMSTDELELGLLLAAQLNGRMVQSVPTPLVRRDLERLLGIGAGTLRRLVLCLDNAELLDENDDLAPSLTQLVDSTSFLTIITAAETAGSLQAAAPRAWAQIEVGPYRDTSSVIDAINKPVTHVEGAPEVKPATPATAGDIAELTGSVPYEVNLVCHFIWDAIQQGEQDAFELSPKVIQRVAAELEEKGRHQASPEIAIYNSLSQDDYVMLLRYAPYEELSIRELALLALMLSDYDETDLEDAEERVRNGLAQLEQKGVVKVEGERFEIQGSRDARLYLKYAAKHHTSQDLHFGETYTRAVMRRCARDLAIAIVGEVHGESSAFRGRRPQELGGATAGSWIGTISQAASARDIVVLSGLFGLSIPIEQAVGEHSFLLSVAHLQVGVYDVEHVDVVVNNEERTSEEATDAGETWIATQEDLLDKYGSRVVEWRCFVLPNETIRAAVAYAYLRLACNASYPVFRNGAREAAETLLGAVIEIAEQLVGTDPADPLLRTQLASALSHYGFMAANRRDWNTALERFQRSRRMFVTEEWLLEYNEAHVRACQGQMELACALATAAVEHYSGRIVQALLHAYLPVPEDWTAPSEQWCLVELRGTWIKRFVELQLLVLRAIVDGGAREDLATAITSLGASAPPPMLRLGGWATLTLLGDASVAAALFARAVTATRYDETDVPAQELAYAEARCKK